MLKNKILSLILTSSLFGFGSVYANIDSFEIDISPKQAKVGDAVDLTIKAIDSNGNVFQNYVGDILIFSDTDLQAEFPGVLSDNTYKFKASDQGAVKFENAVKFTKSGKQFINVYDAMNEDVFGVGEITISTTDVSEVQNTEITISTPSSGTTVGSSDIRMSGKTQRNYKVEVILNADKKFETISNGEGMFDVEITGLESGENSLVANILDASNNIIGSSQEVIVGYDSMTPSILSITTNPENTIEAESVFTIEITSQPGLRSVKVLLDDFLQPLEEKNSGVYSTQMTAPKTEGNYKIDVLLTNEIGTETEIKAAKEILITPIAQNAAGQETELSCEDLAKDLEVKNVKVVKMKSKSVISWDSTTKASSYNVYKKNKTSQALELIENVTQPKIEINIVGDIVEYDDFVIKAVLDNEQCNNIESPNSAEMTQVQTGPKEILLMIIAVLITAFILRRKKLSV